MNPVTTHASLLVRLGDGSDPTAWRDFHTRYGDLIRRFALRQNLPPSDIDDVLQDVLVILTKNMPGFQYDPAKGRFRSYLKTIVVRAVFRRFRQKRAGGGQVEIEKADTELASDAEVEDLWEEEWRQYHLRLAMSVVRTEFNRLDIAAFNAYVSQGSAAAETAEALGLNIDQVYQAKSRIIKRLAELIEQQIEEEG